MFAGAHSEMDKRGRGREEYIRLYVCQCAAIAENWNGGRNRSTENGGKLPRDYCY